MWCVGFLKVPNQGTTILGGGCLSISSLKIQLLPVTFQASAAFTVQLTHKLKNTKTSLANFYYA